MASKKSKPKMFASLDTFETEPVEFLWEPYILRGMVTIMEGDPGVGKSFLAMHVAAMISAGGSLPGQERVRRGSVIYMSQEDGPSHTIRPRIEAMGGDPSKITVLINPIVLDEEGTEALLTEMEERPAALIVIDPLFGFVGASGDPYKPHEIRATLGQLHQIASDYDAAVLIIRHLTKGGKDKAIYRGNGAIDVIAFARSAIAVGLDPDDPSVRVMAHLKHNLSINGGSWAYELTSGPADTVPRIEWLGRSDLTANDLQGPTQDHAGQLAVAEKFLTEFLKDGPKPQTTVTAQAESNGVSARTLQRAKKKLGVNSKKTSKGWVWSLPAGTA